MSPVGLETSIIKPRVAILGAAILFNFFCSQESLHLEKGAEPGKSERPGTVRGANAK